MYVRHKTKAQKIMIKVAAWTSAFAITMLMISPASAAVTPGQPQDNFSESNMSHPSYVKDKVVVQGGSSEEGPHPTSIYSGGNQTKCTSLKSGPCGLEARKTLQSAISGFLTPTICQNSSEIYCIEQVSKIVEGSNEVLTLDHELNADYYPPVEGDLRNGIPSGGSMATLWKSKKYSEKVLLEASLGFMIANGRVYFDGFQMSLRDIKQVQGEKFRKWEPGTTSDATQSNGYRCSYTEPGICGISVYQDTQDAFEVKIRLPKKLDGWLRGQISALTVTQESSGKFVTYKFYGRPAEIQRFKGIVPSDRCLTSWCPQNQIYAHSLRNAGSALVGWGNDPNPYPAPPANFDWLANFTSLTQNTPTFMETAWNVVSVRTGYEKDPCFVNADGLVGVSSSNAMFVPDSAPVYSDGNLEYKVAGLHLNTDGVTVFKGTYDLAIRSDIARCLYGLTKAPIGATIQVLNSNGDKDVSVKTVGEKGGWIRVAASGFTFSSPTIKVKITQKLAASNKKITCLKKGTGKKIVSTLSKCPKGTTLIRR